MEPIHDAEHLLAVGDAEDIYGIPGLPFRPAIRVTAPHELVFVSGVLGPATSEDPDTSIAAEVSRAYRNLARILSQAGGSLGDVVSMTKFVTDIARHNEVVADITQRVLPHLTTTTTVEVVRLVPDSLNFEVSVIAAIRTDR
ncbi:MAG: Rid family hydrolase [Actinomycetota bacterium]